MDRPYRKHIFELPLELFQEILRYAIQGRGLKRGLRLRLVNKLFAREIIRSLFIFELLESFFLSLPDREDVLLPPFTAAYRERRVLNEPNNGAHSLVRIRMIAERLEHESIDGRDRNAYIKQLCPFVVKNCSWRMADLWRVGGLQDLSDLDAHVYVAALYTHTTPVITNWLASQRHAQESSWLVGSSLLYAAKHGTHDLLASMMDSTSESELQRRRHGMLQHVAKAGRLDATRFVFEFQADQWPWTFSTEKRLRDPYYNNRELATADTPSREVFDFLTDKRRIHCLKRKHESKQNTWFLEHCVRKGWTEMAATYIGLGASVEGLSGEERMIVIACRHGRHDVAKLLLARGASASAPAMDIAAEKGHSDIVRLLLDHGADHGEALSKAVEKGYLDIVQILLDNGAGVETAKPPLLAHAVEQEHEAMFRLLLARRCDFSDLHTMAECTELAKKKGLDSMLKLLREAVKKPD